MPSPMLSILVLLCAFLLPAAGQNSPQIQSGIVVEKFSKYFEGDQAGLRVGDVLLSWSRADQKGTLDSPFDLSLTEIEQAPLGRVTLAGLRGTEERSWTLGPDAWGVKARPNFQGALLDLYREGQNFEAAGKASEAAERWRALLAKAQTLGSSPASIAPWLLFHAAGALAEKQLYKEADAVYQAAAESARSNPKIAAQILQAWGDSFEKRSVWDNAGKCYEEAITAAQKSAAENATVALALYSIGLVTYERGDLAKAEEYYNRALAIDEKVAPGGLAAARDLNGLGYVADERGNLAQADEYEQRALALQQKVAPQSVRVTASLIGLGNIALDRGDLDRAEADYSQALTIQKRITPGGVGVASLLNNLGIVAKNRGDLAQAEECHRQALAIRERLFPGSLEVATSFYQLSAVAHDRGDLAKAEQYALRDLAISEKLAPGSLSLAETLENVGGIVADRGDFGGAEAFLHRALVLREKLAPGSIGLASTLAVLSMVEAQHGNLATAEEYDRQALAIQEKVAPDGLDVAGSFSTLGDIARQRGDIATAEEDYRRAEAIQEKLAPRSTSHAETLAALAGIMRKKQQLESGAQFYQQALQALESQTARLGGSEDVRSGFRARHADYYRNYIDLLIAQNKPEAGFEVLERSRARALLELMSEAHMDIRQGADAALLAKERSLQESIRAKSDRRLQLLSGEHKEDQVAALDEEIQRLLAQYEEVEGQIRESSPVYAALTQPQTLSAMEIQQRVLDSDSLLLEYSLGAERSHLFVLSSNSLKAYELPKRVEIEKRARTVYDLLTAQNRRVKDETAVRRQARLQKAAAEFPKAAADLSRMLLGSAASELQNKRLLVVSDGALAYVPFAMLPSPASLTSSRPVPLVVEHEIVNLPSASVVAVLRQQETKRKPPTRAVAVLADPVFSPNDSRVMNHSSPNKASDGEGESTSSADLLVRCAGDVGLERHGGAFLDRLRFTRLEAEAIAAVSPAGQSMQALDFQASRETATSADLGQYRIIHFATHGLLDSRHPELSGLVLSLVDKHGQRQNGFLELQDIYNLNLSADLVVLSACETGLGKEVDGEGLVGLARGFMYAGASRVVASLWNVDDQATAQVMSYFYKNMLADGMRPAAALRAAQVKMWKQRRWNAPYFWAAFQIQGEWN
jgi:CHAT domain-containing protein/tetratricopeptide (TPR) repeat protein